MSAAFSAEKSHVICEVHSPAGSKIPKKFDLVLVVALVQAHFQQLVDDQQPIGQWNSPILVNSDRFESKFVRWKVLRPESLGQFLAAMVPRRKRSVDGACGQYFWLVVWNMTCIFPYVRNNHPNWLSYFSEGWLNHQPDLMNSWASTKRSPSTKWRAYRCAGWRRSEAGIAAHSEICQLPSSGKVLWRISSSRCKKRMSTAKCHYALATWDILRQAFRRGSWN